MWTDAADLRDFYGSALGRLARRMILRRVRAMWPDVRGLSVLGFGYATPFLGPFRAEARRVVAVMPAAQGVLHWPQEGAGLTTLADETNLPFADRSFDRVLLVHALECAEPPRPMLRELWRVLTDGGRIMVVVPNRRGVWARFERTPFGYGRPYSPAQLSLGLRDAMFTPEQWSTALFVPPVRSSMVLSSAMAWEQVGQRWFTAFAGVVIAEAAKQIYAGHFAAEQAPQKAYVPLVPR
jgi:SAM-dependent methyltransferase